MTQPTDSGLKACPFCGHEAELHFDRGSLGYSGPMVQVRCKLNAGFVNDQCASETIWFSGSIWKEGEGTTYDLKSAEQKAITAWNTRPSAPADEAKLHALESQLKQANGFLKSISVSKLSGDTIQEFAKQTLAALSDNAELKGE